MRKQMITASALSMLVLVAVAAVMYAVPSGLSWG